MPAIGSSAPVAASACPTTVAFAARCPGGGRRRRRRPRPGRVLDPAAIASPFDDDAGEPERRRRSSAIGRCLRGYHVARAAGWTDGYVIGTSSAARRRSRRRRRAGLPRDAVRAGRRAGPSARDRPAAPVWVKDETGNVSGSHKARHLMGVMLELLVDEALGRRRHRRPAGWRSRAAATRRSRRRSSPGPRLAARGVRPDLGRRVGRGPADVTSARRRDRLRPAPGETGDPTYHALRAAIAEGAIPFTCQGTENGLAIEGGETLGYEMVERLAEDRAAGEGAPRARRVVVQVGGGALASSVAAAFAEARAFGVVDARAAPVRRPDRGLRPARRAWQRLRDRAAADGMPDRPWTHARRHRSAYMWPWEAEPTSVAHGILDDETYDWLAIVEALARTGGDVVVVDEATVAGRQRDRPGATGIDVDHTGTAGLAGLLSLLRGGDVRRTRPWPSCSPASAPRGPRRGESPTGSTVATTRPRGAEQHHEKLPRPGHPVPQGLQPRRVLPGLRGRRRPEAVSPATAATATC